MIEPVFVMHIDRYDWVLRCLEVHKPIPSFSQPFKLILKSRYSKSRSHPAVGLALHFADMAVNNSPSQDNAGNKSASAICSLQINEQPSGLLADQKASPRVFLYVE